MGLSSCFPALALLAGALSVVASAGCGSDGEVRPDGWEITDDGGGEANTEPLFPLRTGLRYVGHRAARVGPGDNESIAIDGVADVGGRRVFRWIGGWDGITWLADTSDGVVIVGASAVGVTARATLYMPRTVRVGMRWTNDVDGDDVVDQRFEVLSRDMRDVPHGHRVVWTVREDRPGSAQQFEYEFVEGRGLYRVFEGQGETRALATEYATQVFPLEAREAVAESISARSPMTPIGGAIERPWYLAVRQRPADDWSALIVGQTGQAFASDDGFCDAIRCPANGYVGSVCAGILQGAEFRANEGELAAGVTERCGTSEFQDPAGAVWDESLQRFHQSPRGTAGPIAHHLYHTAVRTDRQDWPWVPIGWFRGENGGLREVGLLGPEETFGTVGHALRVQYPEGQTFDLRDGEQNDLPFIGGAQGRYGDADAWLFRESLAAWGGFAQPCRYTVPRMYPEDPDCIHRERDEQIVFSLDQQGDTLPFLVAGGGNVTATAELHEATGLTALTTQFGLPGTYSFRLSGASREVTIATPDGLVYRVLVEQGLARLERIAALDVPAGHWVVGAARVTQTVAGQHVERLVVATVAKGSALPFTSHRGQLWVASTHDPVPFTPDPMLGVTAIKDEGDALVCFPAAAGPPSTQGWSIGEAPAALALLVGEADSCVLVVRDRAASFASDALSYWLVEGPAPGMGRVAFALAGQATRTLDERIGEGGHGGVGAGLAPLAGGGIASKSAAFWQGGVPRLGGPFANQASEGVRTLVDSAGGGLWYGVEGGPSIVHRASDARVVFLPQDLSSYVGGFMRVETLGHVEGGGVVIGDRAVLHDHTVRRLPRLASYLARDGTTCHMDRCTARDGSDRTPAGMPAGAALLPFPDGRLLAWVNGGPSSVVDLDMGSARVLDPRPLRSVVHAADGSLWGIVGTGTESRLVSIDVDAVHDVPLPPSLDLSDAGPIVVDTQVIGIVISGALVRVRRPM